MDFLLDDSAEEIPVESMKDAEDEEIVQEEVWTVIDEYFRKKGLVGQQLDSFDEFIRNTMQELVDDSGELKVTPENQYLPGQDIDQVF
jgi:DNA-directed RNA polymerase II subunit RPB2